jgi:hypothetical protein
MNAHVLSDVGWLRRAAAHIRALDDEIRLHEAVVLAAIIAQRPGCRDSAPELAVDLTFVREGIAIEPRRYRVGTTPANAA